MTCPPSAAANPERVQALIEALPYIRRFSGKTVVVKFGGSLLEDAAIQQTVIQDIAMLKLVGIEPVLVHGGGPAMTSLLTQLQKESTFVQGYRVTDAETLAVAEMVLSGKINKSLVAALHQQGMRAVGLSGQDGAMITVKKRHIEGVDMGFEGEVTAVDVALARTLMGHDFIPVISPIGIDTDGQAYNLNGDAVAVALAVALQAEKLIFLTDVCGVLRDLADAGSRISRLRAEQAPEFIDSGVIHGGMIPKVNSCVEAVTQGVGSVHILDGRITHAILLEIFTDQGLGTMVTP
ncbi:MAG: acetylglutamate kinase [Vampirovibrionales bacterium]|nr:acetylglutamate kinase [Vampirovibrionales bacterium]